MAFEAKYELGAIFILLSAVCDFLDGMLARLLKAYSPIGKELDS
jgi:CDP-diacylglycerol--serine O-phosphatidyltransferase